MTDDARFEDGVDKPLRLRALSAEDVPILASLIQDAVFPSLEMNWDTQRRRFAILLNRYRWEDAGPSPERVQSLLVVEDAMRVWSSGIERGDPDLILSLLTMEFTPGEDGTGVLTLVLAGDGAIAIDVEAIEITLKDVTRPYIAPSKKTPEHPE